MNRAGVFWLGFCIVAGAAGDCSAHGFARYASTPVTPPVEFLWWLPAAVIILAGSQVRFIRRGLCCGWRKSALLSAAIVGAFGVSFYLCGRYAATSSTAPPPGLGMPHLTFWGLGWAEAGGIFVRWNVFGMGLLAFWSLALTKAWKHKGRIGLIGSTCIAYVICMVPYLYSGAWVHGWGGGYVASGCDGRIEIVTGALIGYAEEHEGRFPEAESFDGLMRRVRPYVRCDELRYKKVPLEVCPLAAAYEREPGPYEWNEKYSGKALSDVSLEDIGTDEFVIRCRYHKRVSLNVSFALLEYVERGEL
jgi:hypothetical protein